MAHRFAPAFLVLVALSLAACGSAGGIVSDLIEEVTPPDSDPPPTEPPPTDPPPTDPPPTDPPATSMSAAELAKALECLDIVNAERATEGLDPLAWHDGAAEVAYQHSLDMDVRDYFAHQNPDGDGHGDRLTAAGVSYSAAGENIFWASWHASAIQAMDAWMDSPGHRANILRSGWTHVGIGIHEGVGGSWWTQVFLTE